MAIIKALVTAAALFTTSALGAPVVDKVSLPHITPTATIPGGETHVTSFVTPSPEPWWITVPDTHTVPFTPGPGHWSTVITVRGTPITMGPAPAWATVDKDDEHRRSDWDPVAWRPLLGEAQRGLLGEKVGPVAKRDVAAEVPHNCSDAHRECCPTPKQQNPCGIWGGVWKRNDTDRPPGQVWKRDHAANELPAGPDALHADESHPQSSGRPSTAFDPTADKGNEKVPMMGSCDKGHPECCPTPQNADPCGIWGGVWKRDEDGHADKDDIPWWFWGGKDKRAEDNQAGKGDIPWWFWSGKQQREDNIEKDKGTGCNTFGCPGWPLSSVSDLPRQPWKTVSPEAKIELLPATITVRAQEVTPTAEVHKDPVGCGHVGRPGWPFSDVGDRPTAPWKTITPEA